MSGLSPDAARARAEARFQLSEQRKTDAEKAMQEVQDAAAAERAKTERLRALRLAKEEAERTLAAAQPVKAVRRKRVAPAAG